MVIWTTIATSVMKQSQYMATTVTLQSQYKIPVVTSQVHNTIGDEAIIWHVYHFDDTIAMPRISGDETTISVMETIEYHGNHHDNTHHKAIVTLVMKQSCDMASIVMSHSQVSGDCATDWRAMLECKTLEESEKGRRVILFWSNNTNVNT